MKEVERRPTAVEGGSYVSLHNSAYRPFDKFTPMTFDFLNRIRKELTLTGQAIYETVLAISERVNRRVQILQLHWQAAAVTNRLETLHREVGAHVCQTLSFSPLTPFRQAPAVHDSIEFTKRLNTASDTASRLKHNLLQVDSRIRELKLETVHDNLLKFQQDLAMRSTTLERVVVTRGASVIGRTLADLPLAATTHIVAVFRGPFLLPPVDSLAFRADDVVIVVGLHEDLERLLPAFYTHRPRSTA